MTQKYLNYHKRFVTDNYVHITRQASINAFLNYDHKAVLGQLIVYDYDFFCDKATWLRYIHSIAEETT